jgi:hypothetical protein
LSRSSEIDGGLPGFGDVTAERRLLYWIRASRADGEPPALSD